MATFYKYKSREGEDQVDWRGITKGISDDLSRIQGEREQKRVDIDNAVLTTLETIADKPLGTDAARNEITSDYAAQASAIALENQRLLKIQKMSLKQYNSVTNTAKSSTKKLFNLTRQYQENYQRHMDALKPDKDGLIQGSGLGALLRKQAETLGDPTNTKYYMDPQSGSAYIARVLRDGETAKEGANFRLIDGEAYSLMDVSTAQNIITMDVNRYQAEQVADRIAKAAGIVTEVVMKEDVKTRTDSFNRIFQKDADGNILVDKNDNKVLSEIGEAVTSQIRASFASPMDYASMLYDTLNKPSIAGNDKKGYTNLLTGEKYKGDVKDAIIFITENSQQVPVLTDAQEKQAQEGVLNIIRSKMGITETVYDQRAEDRKDQELNLRKRQVKDQETRTTLQRKRDELRSAKPGNVIFADPNEAFETYIVADEKLIKDPKTGVISGVNSDLFSDEENNTQDLIGTKPDATKQIIQPLIEKFGDLGFSFTLYNVEDAFQVVGPSGGEGIRIDYDEQPEDAIEEYQKLMTFIRSEFDDETILESKYSVIGYDRFGPGAVAVDASGIPVSTEVGVDYTKK